MSTEQYQIRRFVLRTEEPTAHQPAPASASTVLAINLTIIIAFFMRIMMMIGIALFLFLWVWDTSYILWIIFAVILMFGIAICNKTVVYLRTLKWRH